MQVYDLIEVRSSDKTRVFSEMQQVKASSPEDAAVMWLQPLDGECVVRVSGSGIPLRFGGMNPTARTYVKFTAQVSEDERFTYFFVVEEEWVDKNRLSREKGGYLSEIG